MPVRETAKRGPSVAADPSTPATARPVQRALTPTRPPLTSAPRPVRPSYHLDPVGVVRAPAKAPAPAPAPPEPEAAAPAPAPAPKPEAPAPPIQRKPVVRRVSRVQSAAADGPRRRPLIGAPITPSATPAPPATPAITPSLAPAFPATPAPALAPTPPPVQRAPAPEPPADPATPLRKVRLPGPTPVQRAAVAGPPLASARPLTTRHQEAAARGAAERAAAPAPLKQAPVQGESRPVVPLRGPAVQRGVAQPSVQRAPAVPAPPRAVTPVRRESPPPAPATQPAPAPVQRQVQRTAQAPAPTPAPEPTAPEQPADLDALARRLVAPLSRLLRAELRGDRERIGRLRDR
ncbi:MULTISPECIES: hypothetical protein [unclassified Streptomyces]|uniref:hypothetical protein n=1 Tax=unclassified Streptomyces TaxID=2593676 RepID=UPI003812D826